MSSAPGLDVGRACDGSTPASLARPKSRTFTVKPPRRFGSSQMLSGLRSRCTMPRRWASATAEQTCSRMSTTQPVESRPSFASTSASERPSRYSITRYATCPVRVGANPKSVTSTTLGWRSRPAASASRRNRSTNSGSCEKCGWMILTATVRVVPRWVARYTAPIPPCPSSVSMRYLPSRTMFGSPLQMSSKAVSLAIQVRRYLLNQSIVRPHASLAAAASKRGVVSLLKPCCAPA